MNKKGFTLIEIIFSIAFLCVVSVVMLNLLVTSFDVENETDMMDMAIIKVTNEIENLKAIHIDEDTAVIKYYNELWKEVKEDQASYIVDVSVTKNELYDNGLYNIDAKVSALDATSVLVTINTMHYYNKKE